MSEIGETKNILDCIDENKVRNIKRSNYDKKFIEEQGVQLHLFGKEHRAYEVDSGIRVAMTTRELNLNYHIWKVVQRARKIERKRIVGDLILYANHLKECYQIGSMSPFHKLVGRINAEIEPTQKGEKKT